GGKIELAEEFSRYELLDREGFLFITKEDGKKYCIMRTGKKTGRKHQVDWPPGVSHGHHVIHWFPNTAQKLEQFVVCIDELNRGVASRIFGELLTLIEEDKRLKKESSETHFLILPG